MRGSTRARASTWIKPRPRTARRPRRRHPAKSRISKRAPRSEPVDCGLGESVPYCYEFPTEARIALFEFIEGFYNPRRRHSSIGYLSPIDYERMQAVDPGARQPAVVLAAVKDKPS